MIRRNTAQKEIVAKSLHKLYGLHPTAVDVHLEVIKTTPTISRATVYRILGELVEVCQARRFHLPNQADIYDSDLTYHHHLICDDCGQIIDLPAKQTLCVDDFIKNSKKSVINSYSLAFYGYCPKCKKKHK